MEQDTRNERREQREEDDREEALRLERNTRYDAVHKQARAASERGDYVETLRLLRVQQTLRDGPVVTADIARFERIIADQSAREAADATRDKATAAYDRGDWREALVLYRRALTTHADSLSDYGKQRVKELDERLKRETEAADLERRHRPEVERLRAEARAIMDLRPADALEKLAAALELLPDDSAASGDWWLASAALALREARYDDAIQAVKNAQNFAGDSADLAKARAQIADERNRQGASVQSAFGDLRQRLAVAARTDTAAGDPGAQLKSVDRHSRDAQSGSLGTARETARMGFDVPGGNSGNLVYPDKNKHRQTLPSALDKQIPQGAKDDPQIKQMQSWYRSLDAQKAEKEKALAQIMEQQKTSKDSLLDVKIKTLANDVKRLADDQARATETVKERVAIVKKRVLNKGLVWNESPLSAATETPASRTAQGPESPKLDFIRN